MKIVGLITEYNPFHSGHRYHIEQAKKETGADAVIVIMSGNFVQRGEPAIMPKITRAKAALLNGADVVLGLPTFFALGSAEYFASGAISILSALGCIDTLCFGSEYTDENVLARIADLLLKEPDSYKEALQNALRTGNTYPQARAMAIAEYLKDNSLSKILSAPNAILGIEYIKAIKRLDSSIDVHIIKRISNDYHDMTPGDTFSSATSIRQSLLNNDHMYKEDLHLPDNCNDLYKEEFGNTYPILADDFSLLMKYRLLEETNETLTSYLDVSTDLANRIDNYKSEFQSFSSFCELIKSKDLTYSRVSRCLMHILLKIKDTDRHVFLENKDALYARLLGFKTESTSVLTKIKETSKIPMISKMSETEALGRAGKQLFDLDMFAANLYGAVVSNKFGVSYPEEYKNMFTKIR